MKQGPVRGPLSAKPQRFTDMRERGWAIRAAAREVDLIPVVGE